MARKIQVKRGAKADLPVLSQGEFGFCTDAGAEELHIGNGTKNIQIPTVNVYLGDISELVVSGIYRVGAQESLPEGLWYGQLLVMQGADSDTVCQIGMGYTDGALYFRSGQKVSDGIYSWRTWGSAGGSGGDFVAKDGDTMTGVLNISNTGDYAGLQKFRSISDVLYNFTLGVGNDTTRGASASMRLTDDTGAVKGRIDAWANGELTHQTAGSGYLPISRIQTGSYTGTATKGSANARSLTFPFTPRFVMIGIDASSAGSSVYSSTCGFFMPHTLPASYADQAFFFMGVQDARGFYAKWNEATKTLSWYHSSQYSYMLNSSVKYNYIAFG